MPHPKKRTAKKVETPQELGPGDHRTLGKTLDLFSFHDVAPGAVFWHPKGMTVFRELEKYARALNDENGYQEISTPILVKRELFERSGHWEHYRDYMFWFTNPRDKAELLVLKPMNCPESTYLYNAAPRSHRDLPLRLAELGRLHRNERSGTLGGLFRVRQITMDDAHIYVRPDQVEAEVEKVIEIIERFYRLCGFTPRYVLATKPASALGSTKDWRLAEDALLRALEKKHITFTTDKGAGAFYGPKIEVHLDDAQGRDWQLGTAQLDIAMLPKQFKLAYVDEQGKKQMPWVIHRAVFGSFERFIGIMLEHLNGALPLWLSPVQIGILTVNDAVIPYSKTVASELIGKGFRISIDERNETIGKKIREGELQKIPYLLVIGGKEVGANTVAVRERGKGDIGQMPLAQFVATLRGQI